MLFGHLVKLPETDSKDLEATRRRNQSIEPHDDTCTETKICIDLTRWLYPFLGKTGDSRQLDQRWAQGLS